MKHLFTKPSFLGYLLTAFFLNACQSSSKEYEHDDAKGYSETVTNVDAVVLDRSPFAQQIISNGKVKGKRKTQLVFPLQGQLTVINVINGQFVQKNEIIAQLSRAQYREQLELAELKLKETQIQFEDMVMSHNKSAEFRDTLSPAVQNLRIRSGYSTALLDVKFAKQNLDGTILRAPFDGKIANLKYGLHEVIKPNEVFCEVIDDNELNIEFSLLESEVNQVKIGDAVRVTAFSNDQNFKAHVYEINPHIDENGLALIRAKGRNPHKLLDGMNVKVIIEKEIPDQWVVQKSAVLKRDDHAVIFKHKNGKAFWTYVRILFENDNYYAIEADEARSATLAGGDTIIITDNQNLAHQNLVNLRTIK